MKTDRQLLEQIATNTEEIRAQLGEGHSTWKSKGATMRDKLWALAEKLDA